MPFPTFDRSQLKLRPLADRIHDMGLPQVLNLADGNPPFDHPALPVVAQRMAAAYQNGRPVILMMGAHVLKVGLSRFVIDLMERGLINHVAMNGPGPIHDYELALVGASTESVARCIRAGQFGVNRRSTVKRLKVRVPITVEIDREGWEPSTCHKG